MGSGCVGKWGVVWLYFFLSFKEIFIDFFKVIFEWLILIFEWDFIKGFFVFLKIFRGVS